MPHNRISDWSKLKIFADDTLNVISILNLGKVESIVGKAENNAGYDNFLLFS